MSPRRAASAAQRGTCPCKRRPSSMATRMLTAAAAVIAILSASTTACASSLAPPLGALRHSHAMLALDDTAAVRPPRLSRRSPAPNPQGGITLGDPSDTTTSTASDSNTASGSSTSALPAGYSFPQPFDAVLGVNFTSTSCPSFFNRFLADPAFKACAPLSLLLETSTSFFKALQDADLLSAVLDQICAAEADTCSGVMDNYARLMDQTSTCGPDLSQGNALAVSALNGFRNYKLYFQAGCLRNQVTQSYCLTEAANATTPSDLYLYYLPGGTSLPSGEKPTCDACSQTVMNTFSNYASNSTLRISETYVNARNVISLSCGPSFAPMVAATMKAGGLPQVVAGGSLLLLVSLASVTHLALL